ncbi:MAG: regulatory protein RecX [Sulfobacillus thermosulfidooxidans]|uniref:Regulatory protein RecX n=1 Tax=Sulfobacillus thermotolerans TaxID=338644 RepID=A0ABN5GZ96_9FIRM|nr:regulatory protein RecX [Sulfobacillus sp. hq2]AUW93763.1 hypothetical protein BXT84_07250 [Sulfobacillus thermotolerans]MCY0907467.1 regulatory protein RecX [Sulfobacillus thermotolerans]POB11557.1 hypothetical protein CO251_04165 [Sulfobacillus sp. hq2]PSR33301.1 MAG: regulatory protein RecX [Sulfobacillus thermosulfidooxidans]
MTKTSNKDPYLQALRWLGYRDYSRQDLSARLLRAGFPEPLVDSVMDQLEAKGWLDDKRVAAQLIEQCLRNGTMGPRLVVQKLQDKKLPREVWEPLWEERQQNIDWLKIAEGLQERYDIKDDRERIRYGRYLVRRGFPTSIVWKIIGHGDQGG